jgi:hypothetical protein
MQEEQPENPQVYMPGPGSRGSRSDGLRLWFLSIGAMVFPPNNGVKKK